MPDKLLTTRELVDMLQLDRVTIYKMVKDGELPCAARGRPVAFLGRGDRRLAQGPSRRE